MLTIIMRSFWSVLIILGFCMTVAIAAGTTTYVLHTDTNETWERIDQGYHLDPYEFQFVGIPPHATENPWYVSDSTSITRNNQKVYDIDHAVYVGTAAFWIAAVFSWFIGYWICRKQKSYGWLS